MTQNNLHTRQSISRSKKTKTFNAETLTMEAVATTESPATVFSWNKYDFILNCFLIYNQIELN